MIEIKEIYRLNERWISFYIFVDPTDANDRM